MVKSYHTILMYLLKVTKIQIIFSLKWVLCTAVAAPISIYSFVAGILVLKNCLIFRLKAAEGNLIIYFQRRIFFAQSLISLHVLLLISFHLAFTII